jgi:hypothetical protein
MLFLLLRTTLLTLTVCVATVYGAPVQSDTQAMVRTFTSLSLTNLIPLVGFGIFMVKAAKFHLREVLVHTHQISICYLS